MTDRREKVELKVAERLRQAALDPMWDAHAEVGKDVLALGAGMIYGQEARIEDLLRRVGEMQGTMSRMAERWADMARRNRLMVEALAEIKASVDGESDQPVADILSGLIEELG